MTADEIAQELADALPLPSCQCEAHYSVGQGRLCQESRKRDHERQVQAILPLVLDTARLQH